MVKRRNAQYRAALKYGVLVAYREVARYCRRRCYVVEATCVSCCNTYEVVVSVRAMTVPDITTGCPNDKAAN